MEDFEGATTQGSMQGNEGAATQSTAAEVRVSKPLEDDELAKANSELDEIDSELGKLNSGGLGRPNVGTLGEHKVEVAEANLELGQRKSELEKSKSELEPLKLGLEERKSDNAFCTELGWMSLASSQDGRARRNRA